MSHYTVQQEQDVDTALGLLERLVVAAESIAESLVSLDESVSQIRYVMRAAGDEEEAWEGGLVRGMFDVELPPDDAVRPSDTDPCERCGKPWADHPGESGQRRCPA